MRHEPDRPPFEAYRGTDPFVFISYARKDSRMVFAELVRLRDWGVNIWYDEGINPGSEWPKEIARAIKGSAMFLFFISQRSVESINCRNEIYYALSLKKPFVGVYLEDTKIDAFDPGLAMSIGSLQSVVKCRLEEPVYEAKLCRVLSKSFHIPNGPNPAYDEGALALVPVLPLPAPQPYIEPPVIELSPMKASDENLYLECTIVERRESAPVLPAPSMRAEPISDVNFSLKIPPRFLSKGTPGSVLRLAPADQRGMELYVKAGLSFGIGRSPLEADWVSIFLPRSDANDNRSKRISKVHARLEFQKNKFVLQCVGRGEVRLGSQKVTAEIGVTPQAPGTLFLAEDYQLEMNFDRSITTRFQVTNCMSWHAGRFDLDIKAIGAVRFQSSNGGLGLRNSCWLFTAVAFGADQSMGFRVGSGLARRQGYFVRAGGCFWVLNEADNGKIYVNDVLVDAYELVPLTQNDKLQLGDLSYIAQIS